MCQATPAIGGTHIRRIVFALMDVRQGEFAFCHGGVAARAKKTEGGRKWSRLCGMKPKYKVLFITIVPSPYQRDLFGALAARDEVDLSVYYMEAASPDSPWPEKSLRPFERIMPGFWVRFGDARAHVNWGLPDVSEARTVVLSSFTSLTGQWLMRSGLRRKQWLFWGERLHSNFGIKQFIQRGLASPISNASGDCWGRACGRRGLPSALPKSTALLHSLSLRSVALFFAPSRFVRPAGPSRFSFADR